MLTGTTAEWLDKLNAADVPATPLHTLESIFDDPHLRATGFFEECDHPTEGKLLMTRGPKNWSKTPPAISRHAPRLGENTVEILTEIGYCEQDARKIAGEPEGENA
jgi:crotonobetainyl-CoA:carnitine CoA-transferase CaiB-like acyl-CoA transferase